MRGATKTTGPAKPRKKRVDRYANYRAIVAIFKRHFSEYVISVRRVNMSWLLNGDCLHIKKNQFRIRIHKSLNQDAAIHFFIHEFAHVLAWNEKADHGMAWGKAYSRCYRLLCKEWLNK